VVKVHPALLQNSFLCQLVRKDNLPLLKNRRSSHPMNLTLSTLKARARKTSGKMATVISERKVYHRIIEQQ
jgi:hypothetical protein